MGVVGFLDDFIKIRKQRSLGLNKTAKLVGQLVVGVAFAMLALQLPERRRADPGVDHAVLRPRHRADPLGVGRRSWSSRYLRHRRPGPTR